MGDFVDAARSLFLPYSNLACCTACRITSTQFEVYMKMFKTGSVPSGNDLRDSGQWTAVGKYCFLLQFLLPSPLEHSGVRTLREVFNRLSAQPHASSGLKHGT